MDILLKLLENKEAMMGLAGLVAALIGALARVIFKDRAEMAEKIFKTGVEVAYNAVNDKAKMSESKVDDKVAAGLGYLNEYYRLNGKKLGPVDEAKAKLLFSAMHGAEGK